MQSTRSLSSLLQTVKFQHIFLIVVLMIGISWAYIHFFNQPIDPDTLEEIRKNRAIDPYQLEKDRMQILFIKERSWNFIVFACLVLSIGIWIMLSNQGKRRKNFMGYKYRVKDRIDQSKAETLEFRDRLSLKFDSLTSNDLLIAEMLVDGLSTKDISTELNISTASANTARYRLRKKMNLPSETDLTEFLKQN